jgi:hypothetical protein
MRNGSRRSALGTHLIATIHAQRQIAQTITVPINAARECTFGLRKSSKAGMPNAILAKNATTVETPAATHSAIFRKGCRVFLEERKCADSAAASKMNTIVRNITSGAWSSNLASIEPCATLRLTAKCENDKLE